MGKKVGVSEKAGMGKKVGKEEDMRGRRWAKENVGEGESPVDEVKTRNK